MKFSQYQVVLAREPALFWRENVVAVVTVEVAETSYQMLEGLSFCNRERV